MYMNIDIGHQIIYSSILFHCMTRGSCLDTRQCLVCAPCVCIFTGQGRAGQGRARLSLIIATDIKFGSKELKIDNNWNR